MIINNNNNNNNNNNKSNLYSTIRHERYPHSTVHSHNVHTNAICARVNLHETIISIHIYMSTHKHTHRHMYQQTNNIAHTHITNLPILVQLHVCLGT